MKSSYRPMVSMLIRMALPILVICGMASLAAADVADHLIISEFSVKTRTPATQFGSPFIEIANPTGSDIDLSDVYITDAMMSPTYLYYNITLSDIENAKPGGGVGGDFHAKFPDGYILKAGFSLAISLNGSQHYFEAYAQYPDFELFEDGNSPDDIPEMEEVFPASINAGLSGGTNVPVLSDLSESIMLYSWDGTSDLVQDLDYVVWGENDVVRVDKTGVTIGSSTYLADTAVNDQEPVGLDKIQYEQGYRRVNTDEGTETASGGNGVDTGDGNNHDETSENMATTWNLVNFGVDGHEPPAAPESFFATVPIISDAGSIPATPSAGAQALLSVTALTNGTLTDVTFYISIDGGSFGSLAGEQQDDGSWAVTVDGQAEDTVVDWYVVVTNSAEMVATYPSVAPLYHASYTVGPVPDMTVLISEICIHYEDKEFIEILNPLPTEVDMSDYYLTDSVYHATGYWNIGLGANDGNIGGGHHWDFHARFPDGYTIAPGDTIVIGVKGSAKFAENYGFLPDIELFEDGRMADNVLDMRPVFPNSIVGETEPNLSDVGETVILYHYVEGDDLVTDVDMFFWGTEDNYRVDKSGITIGGSTYAPDTPVNQQDIFSGGASSPASYQRIDITEGTQVMSGGNGFFGHDETSENFNETFAVKDADPSRPEGAEDIEGGDIELVVPARTFMPTRGELFPVQFVSLGKSETRVRVFDLEGRLVVTLFDSRFHGTASTIPGAYSSVVWDGRDSEYERVKAGMYIVHLSVVSNATGEISTQTAPVVVATRLSN